MANIIQNIIENIKKFFNNIFGKKQKMLTQANSEIQENTTPVKSNLEVMRENAYKENKVKEIIDITEKNPELLENLSIKQLKVIDGYYDKSLEEINQKLIKFREQLKRESVN